MRRTQLVTVTLVLHALVSPGAAAPGSPTSHPQAFRLADPRLRSPQRGGRPTCFMLQVFVVRPLGLDDLQGEAVRPTCPLQPELSLEESKCVCILSAINDWMKASEGRVASSGRQPLGLHAIHQEVFQSRARSTAGTCSTCARELLDLGSTCGSCLLYCRDETNKHFCASDAKRPKKFCKDRMWTPTDVFNFLDLPQPNST